MAERIAKRMAESGRYSRREAEQLIIDGRVALNGTPVESPAVNVQESDSIAVDRAILEGTPSVHLWAYNRPRSVSVEPGALRQTLQAIVPTAWPVGRMATDVLGLLLLSSSSSLSQRLTAWQSDQEHVYSLRTFIPAAQASFVSDLRRGKTIVLGTGRIAELRHSPDTPITDNMSIEAALKGLSVAELEPVLAEAGMVLNRVLRFRIGPIVLARGHEPGQVRPIEEAERLGIEV